MAARAEIINPDKSPPPDFFEHHIPARPLSDFVGLFWYWRGHDAAYWKERILPMASAGLIINLGTFNSAGISGPTSQSFIIERSGRDELMGIHFNPGGAFPFLGFPLGELHGLNITLSDLWGEPRASQLLSLLLKARTVKTKFLVLENWLTRISNRPLSHHPAVSFALREFQKDHGLHSSAALASNVNLSQRRFIQLFRDEVGLTPKLFCRVQRFREVVKRVENCSDVDWVDVALSCGYFDQAHFNHDFREFSGMNPTEYLKLRTEHLSHVQVRE